MIKEIYGEHLCNYKGSISIDIVEDKVYCVAVDDIGVANAIHEEEDVCINLALLCLFRKRSIPEYDTKYYGH